VDRGGCCLCDLFGLEMLTPSNCLWTDSNHGKPLGMGVHQFFLGLPHVFFYFFILACNCSQNLFMGFYVLFTRSYQRSPKIYFTLVSSGGGNLMSLVVCVTLCLVHFDGLRVRQRFDLLCSFAFYLF